MDDLVAAIVAIIILAIIGTGLFFSYASGIDYAHKEAVEAGVGIYEVVDNEGNVEFRFLTAEEICK